MLWWITCIKSLNLDVRHDVGNDNALVDMLSRAWYREEIDDSVDDEEEFDFFK